MLTKQLIIDEIRQVNRNAPFEWLSLFSDGQLRSYLEHLQVAIEPRGRNSRWIRDGVLPSVVCASTEDALC